MIVAVERAQSALLPTVDQSELRVCCYLEPFGKGRRRYTRKLPGGGNMHPLKLDVSMYLDLWHVSK